MPPSPTVESAPPPLMLSVSGCRGVVGRSLTPDVISRYCSAFARWMQDRGVACPRVVLARDGRRGGDVLARAASSALASSGCDVIDIDVATTPTAGVMVTHLGADAGLVVTASHNPGEWNGLKPIGAEGAAPEPSEVEGIIERFRDQRMAFADAQSFGAIEASDVGNHVHVARVLAAIDRVVQLDEIQSRRFRVVVDSVNASGARPARMLLEALGCETLHLHCDESGVFPHPPEPTMENLSEVAVRVGDAGADIGFAQDPDGDRLAILDASGAYLGEECTLVLSSEALLGAKTSSSAPTLVANLSTSRMIDDLAVRVGARVERSPVGEANVVAQMQESNALLGGEGNGGVIWPEVGWIRDSLAAMALVLALITREGRPIGEIAGALPSYSMRKRKLEMDSRSTGDAIRRICEELGARPGATIDESDGVRIDLDASGGSGRAWIHVRPSNTEPVIRVIAEAPSGDEVESLIESSMRLIQGT